jgi:polysaccharide biosynthesis transport protein
VLAARFLRESYDVQARILIAERSSGSGSVQANPVFAGMAWQQTFMSYKIIQPVATARRLYIIGPKRVGAPPPPAGPSGPDKALFNGFDIDTNTYKPGNYQLQISKDGQTWELQNEETKVKSSGPVGDSVGRAFGFRWLPTIERQWYGKSFSFEMKTTREAADDVRDKLNAVVAPGAARFMLLKFTAEDPNEAAQTLNALMKRFVDEASAQKRKTLTLEAASLDSQMTRALAELRSAETALQNFKIKTATKPRDYPALIPGLTPSAPQGLESYGRQQDLVSELRRQRDDLTAAIQRAKTGQPIIDDLFNIPAVSNSPEFKAVINDLQTNQGELSKLQNSGHFDNYPDNQRVIARIAQIRDTALPKYAAVVMRRLNAQIARADSSVAGTATDLQGIPARSITEEGLTRDKDAAAVVVGMLQKRMTENKLGEAATIADVDIFDPAQAPNTPNKNKKVVLIGIGMLAGLGLGLALALLFDLTDKRVRYADQITSGLGLTILGVIPEISRAKGATPTPEEAAQVIEAFRTVRLNLSHTVEAGGPVLLTISSPSPGDGKSLVSSNLALSFAEGGYRTLLIDGDTRRGELHRTFGAERRPGLLDYLTGEIPLADLRRPTTHPQLTLITGGSRKRNAPELLGGSVMRDLLTSMRSQYDVIIVDSPPLGAGIDPFVLATLTGNLLLVMRAGATERDLAEAKLQIVDQLPIRMVGAVLNDVRASMNEYKYYSYSYGYGATDEVDEKPAALARGKAE